VSFSFAVSLVSIRLQKILKLSRVLHFKLYEPGLSLGFSVYQAWLISDNLVDINNSPGYWGIDI
jgi:hypothetical protein